MVPENTGYECADITGRTEFDAIIFGQKTERTGPGVFFRRRSSIASTAIDNDFNYYWILERAAYEKVFRYSHLSDNPHDI